MLTKLTNYLYLIEPNQLGVVSDADKTGGLADNYADNRSHRRRFERGIEVLVGGVVGIVGIVSIILRGSGQNAAVYG